MYVPTTAATPARPCCAVTDVRWRRQMQPQLVDARLSPTATICGNQIELLHTKGIASEYTPWCLDHLSVSPTSDATAPKRTEDNLRTNFTLSLLSHLRRAVDLAGERPWCRSRRSKSRSASRCCGVGGGGFQSGGRCSGSRGSLTQVHQGLVLGWWPLNRISVRRMLCATCADRSPFAGMVDSPDIGVDRALLAQPGAGTRYPLCLLGDLCALWGGSRHVAVASAETARTRRGGRYSRPSARSARWAVSECSSCQPPARREKLSRWVLGNSTPNPTHRQPARRGIAW